MENQEHFLGTMDKEKSITPDVVAITFNYNSDFTYESVMGFAQQFPTYQTKGHGKEQKHAVVFQLVSYEIATVAIKMWQLVEDWDASLLKINKEVAAKEALIECRDKLPQEMPSTPSEDSAAEVANANQTVSEEPDWAVDPPGVVVAQVVTNQISPNEISPNQISASQVTEAVNTPTPAPLQSIAPNTVNPASENPVSENSVFENSVSENTASDNAAVQTSETVGISENANDGLLANNIATEAVVHQELEQEQVSLASIPEAVIPEVTVPSPNITDADIPNTTNLDNPMQMVSEQGEVQNGVQGGMQDEVVTRPDSVPPLPTQESLNSQNVQDARAQTIDLTGPTAFTPATKPAITTNPDDSDNVVNTFDESLTPQTQEATLVIEPASNQAAQVEQNNVLPNMGVSSENTQPTTNQSAINMNIAGSPQIPTQVIEATVATVATVATNRNEETPAQILHENLPENPTPHPEQIVNVVVDEAGINQGQQTQATLQSAAPSAPQVEVPPVTPSVVGGNQEIAPQTVPEIPSEQAVPQTIPVQQPQPQQQEATAFDGIDPDAFAKPISTQAVQQEVQAAGAGVMNMAAMTGQDLSAHAQNAGQNLNALIDQSVLNNQLDNQLASQATQENGVAVGRYPTQQNDSGATEDFSFSEITVGRFPGSSGANTIKEALSDANDETQIDAAHREIDIGIGELPASKQPAATQTEAEYITQHTAEEGFEEEEDLGLKTVIDERDAKPMWRKLLGGNN